MMRYRASLLRLRSIWICWPILVSLGGGCTVNDLVYEKRACTAEKACAAGYVCLNNYCQKIDAGAGSFSETGVASQADAHITPGLIPGTWITIPAGSFAMGSPETENCRADTETMHQVTLTRAFEMQSSEVTQENFQTVRGYNPAVFSAAQKPVENVSWHEAAAYCNQLSLNAGLTPCYGCSGSGTTMTCSRDVAYLTAAIYTCPGYRLPTEAEWEMAYRGGVTSALYNNAQVTACSGEDAKANEISWYVVNAAASTHEVCQKQKNAWGLCDMAGNVWEWVGDSYTSLVAYSSATVNDPEYFSTSTAATAIVRGGAWSSATNGVRAANRGITSPTKRANNLGFRCVRGRL